MMVKEQELILKLKLKGGNVMFKELIIGDVKLDDNLIKDIENAKKVQEEFNEYNLNKNENDRIADMYIYGPTYSSL